MLTSLTHSKWKVRITPAQVQAIQRKKMTRESALNPLQRKTAAAPWGSSASHRVVHHKSGGRNGQDAMITEEHVSAIQSSLRETNKEQKLTRNMIATTPESSGVSKRKKELGTKRATKIQKWNGRDVQGETISGEQVQVIPDKLKKNAKEQNLTSNNVASGSPEVSEHNKEHGTKRKTPPSAETANKKMTKSSSTVTMEQKSKSSQKQKPWKKQRGDLTKFEKVVANQMHFWCPFHNEWKTHQVHECNYGKITFGDDIWKKIRGDPMKDCKCVNGLKHYWCSFHNAWEEHKHHECPLFLKQKREQEEEEVTALPVRSSPSPAKTEHDAIDLTHL